MSLCKSIAFAAKVVLSPIAYQRASINATTPRRLKNDNLLTPHRYLHNCSPQMPCPRSVSVGLHKVASPAVSSLPSSPFSSHEKCSSPVQTFGRNGVGEVTGNWLTSHAKCLKSVTSPGALGTPINNKNVVELDTPLRQDLLRRPKCKRGFKILGKGTFGLVFFSRLKGREVAVKIAKKHSLLDSGEWNCLHLAHPHIIRILDITENLYHRLIVMEFAGLSNLQQILENPSIDLSTHTKFRYSKHIALAVQYCHKQGILHLDIKPANVVVSSSGCCKLGDFGCSVKIATKERMNSESVLQGTVAYIAPEVLRGLMPSTAADTYSLAMLFWQLLTRSNPFQGEDPHVIIYKVVSQFARPPIERVNDAILTTYANLIRRCWDPFHDKRPILDEIVQELDELLLENNFINI